MREVKWLPVRFWWLSKKEREEKEKIIEERSLEEARREMSEKWR